MSKRTSGADQEAMDRARELGEWQAGAPGGAWQHVQAGTEREAAARPGGATQNSGGAILGNEEQESEPGRGAD